MACADNPPPALPTPDIIFITALSGTGKTTTGDYLAQYCGVHHLDGDSILQRGVTDRPEWKQAAGDITKALFEFWLKREPCPEALWHPFLTILCSQIRETLLRHRQIAVTWVVYRREVRDFLRANLGAGLRFVRLDCEVDVLVRSALARLEEGLHLSKMTTEQWWRSEDPAMQNCGGKRRYGEFSFESYKQMQLENALNGMVEFGCDELDAQIVDVSRRDAVALLRVSTALGLAPRSKEINLEKLKAINAARVKEMFAEMATPTAVSMAKHAKPQEAPEDQWETLLEREGRLENALTVKPTPKRIGPTKQELLKSCRPPRVFARVRPLLEHEHESSYLEGLAVRTALSSPPAWVNAFEDGASHTIGGFDGLFGVDADNRQVFAAAIAPSLPSVMRGTGVSVFCYGHSGTGKTHTMLGYRGEPGIFTQAAHFLLDQISAVNSGMGAAVGADGLLSLHVRFVELYLGKVYDLLNDRKECTLREDAEGALHNPAIVQAREAVSQAEATVHPTGKRVDELMVDLGLNGKLVEYVKDETGHHMTAKCDADGSTMSTVQWFALHEQLVSEAMATIEERKRLEAELEQARALEQRIAARGPPCLGAKVTLVDLAGNDFDKRDVGASHSMQQRRESNHINKDLLAVKECISGIALKKSKIPFRNSGLTRVLQKALLPPDREGTTTIMLATVSPGAAAKVSTTNTLRYAQMLASRTKGQTTQWPNARAKADAKAGGPKPWQKAGKTKVAGDGGRKWGV